MLILVIHNAIEIKAWLVGEPIESAEAHIRAGYPHLLASWQAETIQAQVIEVPEADAYASNLYGVVDGAVVKI